MKEMEKEGSKAWIDCQYLMEANEALHKCRYALQFTYVFAFYLPQSGNFRHHFEMQQTELERQTEELAEMMEKEVKEIDRQEVVRCFKMAEKRLTALRARRQPHRRRRDDSEHRPALMTQHSRHGHAKKETRVRAV